MRRPVSNITGKPTIPVPGRLDIAVLQQLADNVRERLRQLDAEATYLRSIADNGTPKQTIAALEAAILSLRQQLVLLAQQVDAIENEDATGVSAGSTTIIVQHDEYEETSGPVTPPRLDQVPPAMAPVQFNGQQAISLAIENRTSDPGTPTTGQIWLRTDL